ncbi:FrgA protein [Vitiosangium sp. GDMCC 1.1324]|uniref:GspE/PulE/PilB domain-containing protein n=1 Tax=Vitiosangium sp. (strain GDMCC 1.1324) TaxID=2138576 RepID=UPI000D39DE09|nr:FrgA protein [Vitiosangium sp. GDMCC 1.1324]PTL82269.1 FrgA protein [Vitiosangium sp. GDMCC 1.1324]
MPSHLAHTLIAQGLLPQDKAEEALRHQTAQGGSIDTALLERRLLPESQVLHALGEASALRPVNLADFEPNADVASFIPPKIADRLCVVPLSLDGNTLHVACGYPVPKKELEEVGFLLGKPLELWVATEVRVREWISVIYRQPLAPRYTSLLASLDPERPQPVPPAQPAPAPAPAPKPAAAAPAPAPKPTVDESAALTLEMVERLARAVAAEPVPIERTPAAPPAQPQPQPQPQPQRVNGAAPAPSAAPTQPPRPAAPAAPMAPATTPAAAVREPLRLNMPEPARPAAVPQPAPAQPAPVARPAAPPPQAPQPAPVARPAAPAPAPAPAQQAPAQPAAPAVTRPPVQVQAPPPQAPASAPQPVAAMGGPQPRPQLEPRAPEAAAPQSARDEVPDWTLAQARAALKESTRDRDRLIDTALRFGRRTFDYVAAFAVLRGSAVGWDARGDGLGSDKLSQVSIPLDASSVFRTVAITRGSYAGPMPPDSLTRHYLELFGRQPPRTLFLYPVEVRGRLVAVLYGDCGQKPISQRRLSDFILFCQDLPAAFQELILFRKQRLGELRNVLEFDVDVDEPAVASTGTAPSAPPPTMAAGLGWSPFVTRSANALGRAAAMAPLVMSQEERPPPDFGPLLKRLTGPDANQRSSAMAELARSPEASAKVLATHFPGPTAWSRLPVVELPEADELGPIPGALSRLGRPAAQALAPLLDSSDADTRYFALLTAGTLPYAELVDGVLRGLFDYEPDISSAARVAAAALKHLPRLDAAKKDLRQELTSRDSLRRSLAARALGTLHDREAIEGLINLTGSDDEMCAQAAAEALREVTRATLGLDKHAWTAWWAENRQRRRADWLVTALRHPELDIRLAAIEELSRGLNDTLGYYADAPEADREAAVRRWEAAVADPSRARRLALL